MPWGTDQLFGDSGSDPGMTRSVLPRRLFLYGPSRERYLTRYEEILDQVWDDADRLAEIDRVESLIAPFIPAPEIEAFTEAVAHLRSSIDGREQRLRNQLSTAAPADADPLSDPMCFIDSGMITGTFTAQWGSDGSTNATFAITLEGASVPLAPATTFVGPSEDVPGQSIIYLVAGMSDGRVAIVYVALPDEAVAPGVFDVGSAPVESALFFFFEGMEEVDEVYFTSGTMRLDTGAASPGSTWQGSVSLRLWDPPWM